MTFQAPESLSEQSVRYLVEIFSRRRGAVISGQASVLKEESA